MRLETNGIDLYHRLLGTQSKYRLRTHGSHTACMRHKVERYHEEDEDGKYHSVQTAHEEGRAASAGSGTATRQRDTHTCMQHKVERCHEEDEDDKYHSV